MLCMYYKSMSSSLDQNKRALVKRTPQIILIDKSKITKWELY